VRFHLFSGRQVRRHPARSDSGQSLVEFSLVLMPLFLVLLGIIQFGFIFNTYVTMTNASRDATRLGTIYEYDRTQTKSVNDFARNESIRLQLLSSMNLLSKTSPQFSTSSSWSQTGTSPTGTTFTSGDLVIVYTIPSGITDSEPRVGQQITVRAVYHQDLVVPLISALLPSDAGGRLQLTGEVTMVLN
jgi:Flp pilus assembly protein TadG